VISVRLSTNLKSIAFEKDVPFHLRCRSVLLALPSRYPDVESAVRDSPEVNKKNLQKTFQVGEKSHTTPGPRSHEDR
jgi:hypothetical protein